MTNRNKSYIDEFDYLGSLTVPQAQTPTTVAPKDPWLTFLENARGSYSTGGVDSYVDDAKALLGELDTTAYDQLRAAYNANYATNKTSLDQSYQQLLQSLAQKTKENKQQFGAARGTIAENAFGRGRDLYRSLTARGLGASGLQQLGDVQNRMETGRQVSGVAGQYYKTSENIANAEQQGTQQYNTQQQQLSNNLAASLAGVTQQETSYRNAYQSQLASLASQLQQNALAQVQQQYQLDAALAQYQSEKYQQDQEKNSETFKIQLTSQDIPEEMKIRQWMDTYGVDRATAQKEVQKYQTDFQSALAQEALSGYDSYMKNIKNKSDFSSVMTDLSKYYQQGTLTRDDIKNYLYKNYEYISNPEFFRSDFLGVGINLYDMIFNNEKWQIYGGLTGMDSPESKQQIVDRILNYFDMK